MHYRIHHDELLYQFHPRSGVSELLLLILGFLLKVGNDVFGHKMILTLNQNGVQTRGVKVANGLETGVSRMRLTCGEGAGVQMTCEKPSAEAMLVPKEINHDILKEVLTLSLAL